VSARPPAGSPERATWTLARFADLWRRCGSPLPWTRDASRAASRAHTGEPWPCNADVTLCGGWAAVTATLATAPPTVDVSGLDYDDDAPTRPGVTSGPVVADSVTTGLGHPRVSSPEACHLVNDANPRGKTLLVIPDAHAHPEFDNARFGLMGRFVEDHRPDYVCCLGDWWDMPALSSYDKGKRSGEGRRARADIDAGAEAMDLFCQPWAGRAYSPSLDFCMGNHEARLDKYANDAPEVEGILGTDTLGVVGWGWRVHRFMQPGVRVAGYLASHYHPAGIMGRPIGGVGPARQHFAKMHESTLSGHSHIYDTHTESTAAGRVAQNIVAGCITHPDDSEGWSLATSRMWRRCIVLVHLRGPGHGDIECWSLDRLTERYGRRAA